MKWCFLIASIFCWIPGQGQHYKPDDAGSLIQFKIRNFGLYVEGSLKGLAGSITFDGNNLRDARFDVSVQSRTVDTGIALRDKHLKKEDYLDAGNFPFISFVSTSAVTQVNDSKDYQLTGKLTLKGVSKEILVPFSISELSDGIQFKGELTINRNDFKVGGSSLSMGDEVKISLRVKAVPTKP